MKLIGCSILLFLFTFSKANSISLLTYNVNYSFVSEKVLPILETIDADIVCLQETNSKWEKIIRDGLDEKYTHIEFRNSGKAGGLAILSKYPILKIDYLKNEPGWFRAAKVTILKKQDTLQLLNVHLKPPLTSKGWIGWNAYFKAQEIHIAELKVFFKSLSPYLPTIILGDFNENDKGKAMEWLAKEMAFKDALPLFDKRSKTWRFLVLRGRYDHLVFNEQLSCINAKVFKKGKSDHFPVLGTFNLK